jgi:hypothetical protein
VVAAADERRGQHRALQDDAGVGLVARGGDGGVEERLVRDDARDFDAVGGRDDHLGARVVDAHGQLGGGEPAEHDRVDGAEPRAGEHGDDGVGHHRHVDEDAIAPGHAEGGERAGEARRAIAQLAIGEALDGGGDRAVVDERDAIAVAGVDVAVDRVVADVEAGAGEPTMKRRAAGIEHAVPRAIPADRGAGLGPERVGLGQRAGVGVVVARHAWRV